MRGGNVEIVSDATTSTFLGYDIFGEGLESYIAGQSLGNLTDPSDTTVTFKNRTATTFATITRSKGDWIADKFDVGQEIKIIGSQFNDNLTFHIASLTPTVLTLTPEDFLVDETDIGTAAVQELFTSVLPQNVPLEAVDKSGQPVMPAVSPTSFFRPGDILKGLGQQLALFNVFPVFEGVQSTVNTSVGLWGTTQIDASGDVNIAASTVADTETSVPSFIVGAVYADSTGIAATTLGTDVNVHAGGNFTLESLITHTMKADVSVSSGLIYPTLTIAGLNNPFKVVDPSKVTGVKIPGPSFSVAYGKAVSTSTATVQNGATVTAGQNATIDSHNSNDFETSATSTVVAPGLYDPKIPSNINGTASGGQPIDAKNQGSGASVTVSNYASTSATQVDGSVTTGVSATVSSESLNDADTTLSETVVRNKPLLEPVLKAVGGQLQIIANSLGSPGGNSLGLNDTNLRQKTGKLGIAAGVAYAQSTNQADAHIGTTGAVNAGGDLTVNAQAEDPFRASAIGAALSMSEIAIGGAVAISNESNQAFASIDSTVGVNSGGNLAVSADAKIPMQINTIQQVAQLYSFFNNNTNGTTPLFAPGDFTDLPGLITARHPGQSTPLDAYLWNLIPAADQQTLLSTTATNLQLETTLDGDLNTIISQGSSIYDQARFNGSGVTLSGQPTSCSPQGRLVGTWSSSTGCFLTMRTPTRSRP